MGNGLIFAFVVALWAAYFVPLALRRYDEATKAATVEKLSALARVVRRPITRSEDDSQEAEVLEDSDSRATTDDRAPEVVSKAEKEESATVQVTPRPRITREASRIAAQRRRRTLLTLLAGLAITVGLAVASIVPWWGVAVPVTLIVAWLVACRLMVRSELGLNQKFDAPTQRRRLLIPGGREKETRGTAADEEVTVVLSGQIEDVEPHRKNVMEVAELEADALEEKLQIAVPVSSQTGEALWDPLPVTLPTYLTKPRAGRTVRTIQLGEPGSWSSGHIEGEDVELPKPASRDDHQVGRAVGE